MRYLKHTLMCRMVRANLRMVASSLHPTYNKSFQTTICRGITPLLVFQSAVSSASCTGVESKYCRSGSPPVALSDSFHRLIFPFLRDCESPSHTQSIK